MKKLVRIGGGSSGYTVLRALKQYPVEITAIMTMFDSGGSTGVLRDEYGVLPPGDIRRALAALADGEHSEILRALFNFRFSDPGSVNGHSFGNLFLTALTTIYGSDIEAIRKASDVLHVKGTVLPVSLDTSHLRAVLKDGTEINGETNIDVPKHDGSIGVERVFLDPPAIIFEEADKAIREADVVVIGPGDLYTSIIPNLLVKGMPEALQASKAKKVVVCNLMTKWGETHDFNAADMVREVLKYSGLKKVDVAVCNTESASARVLEAYAAEKQYPMMCDASLSELAHEVVKGEFLSEADIARHDAEKLAKVLSEL